MRTINEMVFVTSELRNELNRGFAILNALKSELIMDNRLLKGEAISDKVSEKLTSGVMVDLDENIGLLCQDVSAINRLIIELRDVLITESDIKNVR